MLLRLGQILCTQSPNIGQRSSEFIANVLVVFAVDIEYIAHENVVLIDRVDPIHNSLHRQRDRKQGIHDNLLTGLDRLR